MTLRIAAHLAPARISGIARRAVMSATGLHAVNLPTGLRVASLARGRLGPMANAHSVRARMVIALPARSVMLANAAKDAAALAASLPAEAALVVAALAAVGLGAVGLGEVGLGEVKLVVAALGGAHQTVAATSRAGRASRSSDGWAHANCRR